MIRPVLGCVVQDGVALSANHRLPPFPEGKELDCVGKDNNAIPSGFLYFTYALATVMSSLWDSTFYKKS